MRLPVLRSSPRLRRALIGLVGAYAAYLVLANVFLGFHLLDRVVTAADGTFELRTGRAWSLVPGRASVRDLVLRVDGDDVQMRLTVARAHTSISLWRLLRREVRLDGTDASGVSFRLRMRVEAIGPANAERVAALPEIEGALGPPLLSAAKPVPVVPVEEAWHVDLQDAVAQADEVWVEEYRLTGEITAAGGFTMWPGKSFVLPRSTARVTTGTVRVGDRIVTSDLQLPEAVAEIAPVPLAEVHAADVLRSLTASAVGTSTLQDASFLDVYGPRMAKVRVQPSKSTFDVRFGQGRFLRGTTAELDVAQGTMRAPGLGLEGSIIARVNVPEDGDLELGADTDSARLELDALPSTRPHPWTLHATSARQILHAVIGEPVQATLGAYKGELRAPTLGFFEDLATLGVETEGHAAATFELVRDAAGPIHGSWHAHVDDGVIRGSELAVAVSNTTHGEVVTKANPAEGVTLTRVHVEAPRASVRAKGRSAHTTWLRADVPSFTVALEPRLDVRGSADVTAGDGGLVAGVVECEAGLVLGTIGAQLLQTPGMTLRIGVAAVEREITVDVPRATIGLVDTKGFWMRHREKTLLAFLLEHPPLSVGVRIGEGIPLVLPTVTSDWLAAQRP